VGNYPNLPSSYDELKKRFNDKVKPENNNLYETYELYLKIFEDAYKTFFP
jgi:hypothetical protein